MKFLKWLISAAFMAIFAVTQTVMAASAPGSSFPIVPAEDPVPMSQDSKCQQTGKISILFFAESLPGEVYQNNDAVFLVGIDFGERMINIVPLSDKFMLSAPGLAKQNIRQASLSELYRFTRDEYKGNERRKMDAGIKAVRTSLKADFQFTPDHYVAIRQTVLADIVNAMGGLKINLQVAVDGTAEKFSNFHAGAQTLNGEQIVELLSIKKPSGKAEPSQVQRLLWVLDAMYTQFGQASTKMQLPSMMEAFHKNSVTDLNILSVMPYSCLLTDHEFKVNYVELPSDYYETGDKGEIYPKNPKELGEFLNLMVGNQ